MMRNKQYNMNLADEATGLSEQTFKIADKELLLILLRAQT